MKPNDVTSDSYAEYNVDSNEKDSKIKVGVHVGFGACPQIMVAKSFSGVKYHINIEYKGKNFFLILTVSRAKTCPDLGIRPKNLGKKNYFFFQNSQVLHVIRTRNVWRISFWVLFQIQNYHFLTLPQI